jgi:hypothetical protein
MHSNKTVYSSGRYYIYVGGRLRLAAADGIGNNQPGAKSFHDCRSDHMSLVRLLWSRLLWSLRIKSDRSKMQRPCAVDLHVGGYNNSGSLEDATGLSRGILYSLCYKFVITGFVQTKA